MDLTCHKRSDLTVNASWYRNPNQRVMLTRWYNGNPVGNSTYELTPDEADQLADMLRNYAAEARAPIEERERFEAVREKAIAETGPGTAPSFTEWRKAGGK